MERKRSACSARFWCGTVTPLPALRTSAIGEGLTAFWWDAKPEDTLFPHARTICCAGTWLSLTLLPLPKHFPLANEKQPSLNQPLLKCFEIRRRKLHRQRWVLLGLPAQHVSSAEFGDLGSSYNPNSILPRCLALCLLRAGRTGRACCSAPGDTLSARNKNEQDFSACKPPPEHLRKPNPKLLPNNTGIKKTFSAERGAFGCPAPAKAC